MVALSVLAARSSGLGALQAARCRGQQRISAAVPASRAFSSGNSLPLAEPVRLSRLSKRIFIPCAFGPPGIGRFAPKSHAQRPTLLRASTDGSDSPAAPIGIEGLKSLLEEASASLGRCRFIVANTASGGILETVQDFGVSPFRYSEPSPRGQYATLGTSTFECHFNLEKIKTVIFAKKKKADEYLQGELGWMYIIRFLDADGAMAVSVVLHQSENGMEGNPQGWEALKSKYGESVQI